MSSGVVVDASVAVKWVLREDDSHMARNLLSRWIDKQIVVLAPTLFTYEISNILYRKIRQGVLSVDRAKLGLTKIVSTGLEIVDLEEYSPSINIRAIELAAQFNLSATYDAHYLALAEREDCDVWTADARLWKAVKGEFSWVRLLRNYRPETL